jgi:Raf kinase inhibitor-like YbhB/YbcL family protein
VLRAPLSVATVAAALTLAACSTDGRVLAPAGPDQTLSIKETTTTTTVVSIPTDPNFLVSGEWDENGVLDARHACEGDGSSPPLSWSGVPAGAQELALVAVDQTAANTVHWVLAGIVPTLAAVSEAVPPPGALSPTNAFGSFGWEPPCPPAGQPHTYVFSVYALTVTSGIDETTTLQAALDTINASAFAVATTSASLTR